MLGGDADGDLNKEDPTLRRPVAWLAGLTQTYSWRLLVMVIVSNHLLKGFVAGGGDDGLVGKPIEFIGRELGIPASRLQMLKAVAISPWALKPLLAIISDGLPLFGYKKMPYVVITTCGALVGALVLGLEGTTSTRGIVICLFFVFLQAAAVDLLVEAKQCEEVKRKASLGPHFFMFTWLGINFGQVASVLVPGPLIYFHGPWVAYLVAAPFIALVLWPTLGNYLNEKPLAAEGFVFLLALISAVVLVVAFRLFLRPEIAGPLLFYFMLGLLTFNIEGALFYFFTDTAEEYAEGPHFTAYFYTTGLGVAVFGGYIIGTSTGTELFEGWSYRGILRTTILLRMFSSLLIVPMLLRWTSRVGIPDHSWILAATFLDCMFMAWAWIPKQVMGAHLTPQGMEATMLGLSAGTFNLARILSSYCGAALLQWFGVNPAGELQESAMFDQLWKVQVIAACAPALMLLLLPALMPAKTQTEPLILDHCTSASHGSLFDRFMSAATAHERQSV